MKKFPLVLVIIAFVLIAPVVLNNGTYDRATSTDSAVPLSTDTAPASRQSSGTIEAAFRAGSSGATVREAGVVEKALPDDEQAPRHQRFIVRLSTGHTVLIAHNIDIAPRIPALAAGSEVEFQGVYEWNEQGGVVHWTHHDPGGVHPGGYLLFGGTYFQ